MGYRFPPTETFNSDEGRWSKSKELKATQSQEEEEKSNRNLLKVPVEDKNKKNHPTKEKKPENMRGFCRKDECGRSGGGGWESEGVRE